MKFSRTFCTTFNFEKRTDIVQVLTREERKIDGKDTCKTKSAEIFICQF